MWIDCNSQLPEIYDFVLVCANNKGTGEPKPISIARLDNSKTWEFCNEDPYSTYCQGAYMDIEYCMLINDITHWMPLPKPPKEQEL